MRFRDLGLGSFVVQAVSYRLDEEGGVSDLRVHSYPVGTMREAANLRSFLRMTGEYTVIRVLSVNSHFRESAYDRRDTGTG